MWQRIYVILTGYSRWWWSSRDSEKKFPNWDLRGKNTQAIAKWYINKVDCLHTCLSNLVSDMLTCIFKYVFRWYVLKNIYNFNNFTRRQRRTLLLFHLGQGFQNFFVDRVSDCFIFWSCTRIFWLLGSVLDGIWSVPIFTCFIWPTFHSIQCHWTQVCHLGLWGVWILARFVSIICNLKEISAFAVVYITNTLLLIQNDPSTSLWRS